MGADFLFATSPQPSLNDDRRKAIKELLEQIPYQDLLDVQESFGGFDDCGSAEAMRQELFDTIEQVCEMDNRETSNIQLDGMDWMGVITGGMSWGDVPTDAFEPIAMIGWFPPVWDLLKHFAQEDLRGTEARK